MSGSRSSSTDDGFIILDQQNMLSEERMRTEKSLKNIFQWIALFRYEDARSAINQAFDSTCKQSGTAGGTTVMAPLRSVILVLVDKEREYVLSDLWKLKSPFKRISQLGSNLHNMASRSYVSHNVLRLKDNLHAIARDVVNSKTHNDVTDLVRTVATELEAYVNARFSKLHDQVIAVFCHPADAGDRTPFYRESIEVIADVKRIIYTRIKCDALAPLKDMLLYEAHVTEHLCACCLSLTQWDFAASLLHLQTFNNTWKEFLENYKKKERDLVGKKVMKGDDQFPELYQWFYKVYELLLSKYTIYFSKTLFLDNNKRALKNTTTALIDYRTKLIEFCKKSKAASVSLILNTSDLDRPFLGHGYKLPGTSACRRTVESHGYTDKFEVIFHHGCGREEALDEATKSSIVYIFGDVIHKQSKPYLCDQKANRTYYLSLFDVNVFLAVIYNAKKSEKDGEVIKFLDEFKSSMNLCKV